MLDRPPQDTASFLKLTPYPGGMQILPMGDWIVQHLPRIEGEIKRQFPQTGTPRAVTLDLSRLGELDTAGALALVKLRRTLVSANVSVTLAEARVEHGSLLDEVERYATPAPPAPRVTAFERIGRAAADATTSVARDAVRLTAFLGETTAGVARIAARPWRFRWTSFVHHIHQTGFTAVPIICLVCFLIGGVVMQQGVAQLRWFGAEAMAIDMLAVLALREVGILLTAVMVAGRSASAFTAQIGTMKMREEIDAMRTLGIDPVETLVVPRILALIVVMPLLVFIANIMCLAGGALMAKIYLDIDLPIYLERLNGAIDQRHFFVGMIKAPFAALIIGLVGCLEGLSVQGSAESLGRQVTSAVVKAIFLVLAMDGLFAMFLSASGF
jgi:phospholipid/cholesterol/gamma-HCH transport system permease protein